MSYSYTDIRAGKTTRMFVQEFLRSYRATGWDDEKTQLHWLLNKIHSSLRMTLPKLTPETTLATFMQELDDKEEAWKAYTMVSWPPFDSRQFNQNRNQGSRSYQKNNNTDNRPRNWNFRPQQQQSYGFPGWQNYWQRAAYPTSYQFQQRPWQNWQKGSG